MNPLTRKSVLYGAEQCIMHSRATEYGDMEDNFQTIANLWDTWLMARYRRGQVQIDALDVAVMMNQLKVARIASNPKHEDNYIDGVGYLACAGEIASKQEANT